MTANSELAEKKHLGPLPMASGAVWTRLAACLVCILGAAGGAVLAGYGLKTADTSLPVTQVSITTQAQNSTPSTETTRITITAQTQEVTHLSITTPSTITLQPSIALQSKGSTLPQSIAVTCVLSGTAAVAICVICIVLILGRIAGLREQTHQVSQVLEIYEKADDKLKKKLRPGLAGAVVELAGESYQGNSTS